MIEKISPTLKKKKSEIPSLKTVPGYVFLLRSLSLLMFSWLSKQRRNLTQPCRHAFTTDHILPANNPQWLLKGGCQAIGSGYEAAAATAQDEQC